jgi:hypothetical protein
LYNCQNCKSTKKVPRKIGGLKAIKIAELLS